MSVKAIVKEYVENEGVEYKGVFPHFIKHFLNILCCFWLCNLILSWHNLM